MVDVSIIIPAYNAEKYIEIAFQSILSQKYLGSFEILVADDCSTDRTKVTIEQWRMRFPDIIKPIYRKTNLGVSRNYVDLVNKANGKYVAFCDSDDYWIGEDKLQNQFDFMEHNPQINMLCSPALLVNAEGKSNEIVNVEYAIDFEKLIRQSEDVFCSNLMFRKEAFLEMIKECDWYIEKNWFYDTVWSYYFSYHKTIGYIPQCYSAYRVLNESDSHTSDFVRNNLLEKRNFYIKAYFLATHNCDPKTMVDVLGTELDAIYESSYKKGQLQVQRSKTYLLGSLIKKVIKLGRL